MRHSRPSRPPTFRPAAGHAELGGLFDGFAAQAVFPHIPAPKSELVRDSGWACWAIAGLVSDRTATV